MMRVLIADDEPFALATLRKLLGGDPDVEVVAECSNGDEVIAAVRACSPDVMFLDIQMPGTDGLAALEALSDDERPVVVFTTAYDEHALRAFEENAVDYLLKPFDDERFGVALDRARERVRNDELVRMGEDVLNLVEAMGDRRFGADIGYSERLSIPKEGRVDVVDVADIDWVEAADQYVRVHAGDVEYLMRQSMAELERRLDPERFLRTHRSALVALDRIVRLESRTGTAGRIQLRDGTWVPVSRARIPEVRRRLV
jgi:two-component system LytT family response regulator